MSTYITPSNVTNSRRKVYMEILVICKYLLAVYKTVAVRCQAGKYKQNLGNTHGYIS
jgi:hypothetical protein